MSYFSHNPEAYEEIECKGIARKFASIWVSVWPDTDQDSIEELLRGVIEEIKCKPFQTKEERTLEEALRAWAHIEIKDQEQAYFERFIS